MAGSKFYEDKRKEELFGEWLDTHFYNRFVEDYKSIKRNRDAVLQKKGVDVIIETMESKSIYIDEKATLQYINKNIPTFAFEIRNDTSGARGWLYNPEYITHYYLLAWPNATDERILSAEDFTTTEVMSIKRERVIQLLEDKGLTEQTILDAIEQYKYKIDKCNKFEVASGITLNFNLTLAERPINVVIKKKLLERYADYVISVN